MARRIDDDFVAGESDDSLYNNLFGSDAYKRANAREMGITPEMLAQGTPVSQLGMSELPWLEADPNAFMFGNAGGTVDAGPPVPASLYGGGGVQEGLFPVDVDPSAPAPPNMLQQGAGGLDDVSTALERVLDVPVPAPQLDTSNVPTRGINGNTRISDVNAVNDAKAPPEVQELLPQTYQDKSQQPVVNKPQLPESAFPSTAQPETAQPNPNAIPTTRIVDGVELPMTIGDQNRTWREQNEPQQSRFQALLQAIMSMLSRDDAAVDQQPPPVTAGTGAGSPPTNLNPRAIPVNRPQSDSAGTPPAWDR